MKNREWNGLFWKDLFGKFRIHKKGRIEFLKSTAFFRDFSNWETQLTSDFLHERTYAKGEYIFEIGQPGAALYFIETGKVCIEAPGDKGEMVRIADLEPGAFFGELALIEDSPRSASARAESECVILALPRSELDRILKERPVLGGRIFKTLAEITGARLKATIEKMQNSDKDLKLVMNG